MDESLGVARFDYLPTDIRKAINALVPAEGRAKLIGEICG
jgi:hypothetical protein